MALRLTMGFSDNPRVQPLKDGIVKPQGIELDCITLDPSNLFQRNLTYDEFDVSDNGRTKELSHGGALGLATDGPAGVTHHWLTVDQTLDVMLDRGEIDACTAIRPEARVTAGDTTVVDRWGGTPIEGNPRLRKLLDDNGKGVVYEFYRKTGCFQANHHVIVQNRILKEHPWVALELFKAFQRSKDVAYERARRSQSAYLFFPGKDFQEQAAVFGDDPYPIGLRAMGKNIERAIRGSLEQGLLRRPLRLEDIYYRPTLNT